MKASIASNDIKGRLRELENRSVVGDLARVRHVSKRAKEQSDGEEKMTSDEWCSPLEIQVPLFNLYGGPVGIDPCSNERSIIKAHLTYSEGGLIRPWCRPLLIGKDKETGYSNWPYSQNMPWAAKALREMHLRNLNELVVLCMFAASTDWWKGLMTRSRRNPRVIATKRLKFIGPSGKPMDSSRFEPALIYYGKRTKAFDREFRHVAMWSTWGR